MIRHISVVSVVDSSGEVEELLGVDQICQVVDLEEAAGEHGHLHLSSNFVGEFENVEFVICQLIDELWAEV